MVVQEYDVGSLRQEAAVPNVATTVSGKTMTTDGEIHYGRIVLAPSRRQLLIDGEAAKLGGRAFDVLMALVERKNQPVSKGALLDTVWAGLIVEENNLQVQIATLRKLLGRSSIITIPGRGYQFTLIEDGAERASPHRPEPSAFDGDRPRLFGRENDLAQVLQLTTRHRIVTITGVGGVGKTALAGLVARELGDSGREVVWVDLAPVGAGSSLVSVIASALKVAIGTGGDPILSLVKVVQGRNLLLVIDNAEHLTASIAPIVQSLIQKCASILVVVTSQIPLGAETEAVYRLDVLHVPPDCPDETAAASSAAVALFVDRVRSLDRTFRLTAANFQEVVSICRHLDGIPLALRLAAARVPLLGTSEVENRLSQRFRLLASHVESEQPRHRSLMSALEWGYSLLEGADRTVLRRLSVFNGGFGIELASAVASDGEIDEWSVIDRLANLVDHSLVEVSGDQVPRYALLESVREFALLKLQASGELDIVRQRHAKAVCVLYERAHASYLAGTHKHVRQLYGPDLDNLRSALRWAAEHDKVKAVALLGASSDFAYALSLRQEWRRWFRSIEPLDTELHDGRVLARYWLQRSLFHLDHRNQEARSCANKAGAISRDAGDPVGEYIALCYAALTRTATPDAASEILERATKLEDQRWPPRVLQLRTLAEILTACEQGRYVEAEKICERALSKAELTGPKEWIDIHKVRLADVCLLRNDPKRAERLAGDALVDEQGRARVNLLHALSSLSAALIVQNRFSEARRPVMEFFRISRNREWDLFHQFMDACAVLAVREGRPKAAARLLGYADLVNAEIGKRMTIQEFGRSLASSEIAEKLGIEEFERVRKEGEWLNEESAIALTLSERD